MFRTLFRPLCTVTARALKNPNDNTVRMWLEFPKGSELHDRFKPFDGILNFTPYTTPSDPPPEAGISGKLIGSFSKKFIQQPGETIVSTQVVVNEKKGVAVLNSLIKDYFHLSPNTAVVPTKYAESPKYKPVIEQIQKENGLEIFFLQRSIDKDKNKDAHEKIEALAAPIIAKEQDLKPK